MKMTCENFMEKYLLLDKNEFLPLNMTVHLLFCNECRTVVRKFSKAEKLTAQMEQRECKINYENSINNFEILQKILKDDIKIHKVHLYNWIFIGIILLICMVFCSIILNRFIPQMQNVWFVFIATVICTYCVIFVGMNMDFFVKLTDTNSLDLSL